MDIILSVAILLIQVVGFGLVFYRMKQQIGALKGTVDTQAEALKTVVELNKTAPEMARAFDPKKYLDMVETHEKLVKKTAAVTMEDMRRSLEQEHQQTLEQSKRGFELAMQAWENALRVGLDLVAYVPPARRRGALASADVPQHLKEVFLKTARGRRQAGPRAPLRRLLPAHAAPAGRAEEPGRSQGPEPPGVAVRALHRAPVGQTARSGHGGEDHRRR
jgi:hypothetical protein